MEEPYTSISVKVSTGREFNETAKKSETADSFLKKMLILYKKVSPLVECGDWENTLKAIDECIKIKVTEFDVMDRYRKLKEEADKGGRLEELDT